MPKGRGKREPEARIKSRQGNEQHEIERQKQKDENSWRDRRESKTEEGNTYGEGKKREKGGL